MKKAGEFSGYTVPEVLSDDEYALISTLASYPEVVSLSAERYEPSVITRYAVDLSEAFNKFYFNCKILGEEEAVKNFRLALTLATKTVLKNALSLLGIKTPEKM